MSMLYLGLLDVDFEVLDAPDSPGTCEPPLSGSVQRRVPYEFMVSRDLNINIPGRAAISYRARSRISTMAYSGLR